MNNLNPELRRYGWLEFSAHRLLAMPIVLGILMFLLQQSGQQQDGKRILLTLAWAAFSLFALLLGVWGGHKAAEAVLEEVNDKTWDFQRLSSQTPWALTLGKLFGAPSYAWYGGFMMLAVYLYCAARLMDARLVFSNAVLMLCAALLCHAVALLSSLQSLDAQGGPRRKMRIFGHHIIGLVFGSWILMMTASLPPGAHEAATLLSMDPLRLEARWYGMVFPLYAFAAVCAVVFTLWAVFGVYTKMRSQLRMRTGPGAWIGFMAFVLIFLQGKAVEDYLPNRSFAQWGIFLVALTFTYAVAFSEGWNGTSYRRLRDRWKKHDYAAVWVQFPRWMASFVLLLITALVTISTTHFSETGWWMMLGQIIFLCRDVLLLHFFRLNPRSRRPQATTLFYLAVLYVLLPTFFGAVDAKNMVQYLIAIPISGNIASSASACVSGALQTGVMAWLVHGRWKRHWSQV